MKRSVVRWAGTLSAVSALLACDGTSGGNAADLDAQLAAPDASGDADNSTDGGSTQPSDGGMSSWTWQLPSSDAAAPQLSSPRSNLNVFFSGHSLLDNPLAEDVTALAQNAGQQQRWNEQIILGSPLRIRTRGDSGSSGWDGYRRGKNRSGQDMNVIEELKSGSTLSGARYDTLVITENHNMLDMLIWEDTVRLLRHYHDRFIDGNAQGRSYFYTSWLGITDKNNPDAWFKYEQNALPAWECVVSRVNRSLEAEGRTDRLTVIPANMALATLLSRATSSSVPGVSAGSKQETINRLITDDVHLTRAGVYYMALVTYGAIYRRSPVGGYRPNEVDASMAASLQNVAWEVVSYYYANEPKRGLSECAAHMQNVFCASYYDYKGKSGDINSCKQRFGKTQVSDNPLAFEAASDKSYWHPAP